MNRAFVSIGISRIVMRPIVFTVSPLTVSLPVLVGIWMRPVAYRTDMRYAEFAQVSSSIHPSQP